jgi:hypothetical protein
MIKCNSHPISVNIKVSAFAYKLFHIFKRLKTFLIKILVFFLELYLLGLEKQYFKDLSYCNKINKLFIFHLGKLKIYIKIIKILN